MQADLLLMKDSIHPVSHLGHPCSLSLYLSRPGRDISKAPLISMVVSEAISFCERAFSIPSMRYLTRTVANLFEIVQEYYCPSKFCVIAT